MQINSISSQNFGKIKIDSKVKEDLLEHAAYGIACDDTGIFKEKFRLCNDTKMGEKYDIYVTENGVQVKDNKGFTKDFNTDKYPDDTPNLLYHLLNVAMNYVDLKESRIFK